MITTLFTTALLLVPACSPTTPGSSAPECPLVTKAEWQKDMRRSSDMIEGYGAVYDTYVKLARKSDARNVKACEMERIWCPAPYGDKGCQVFKCEIHDSPGAMFRVKDHQGERYFKVEQDSIVRWNGYTFTCQSR